MYCSKCGTQFEGSVCPNCQTPTHSAPTQSVNQQLNTPYPQYVQPPVPPLKSADKIASLQVFKLVIGICSLVLSIVIIFQSCTAGVANVLASTNSSSGSMGAFLGFSWIVAGIISIAAKKSIGGSYTAAGFYLLAGIVGMTDIGIFADLLIWSILSLAFGGICLLSAVFRKGETLNAVNIKKRMIPLCVNAAIYVVIIIIVIALGNSGKEVADSNAETVVSTLDEMLSSEAKQDTQQKNQIDELTIDISSVLIDDRINPPRAIIAYQFTNNGEDAVSFDNSFICRAYQNGISIDTDFYYDGDYPQLSNSSKSIQTGATLEVYEVYILSNITSSIDIEVKGFFTFDDTKVTRSFQPNEFSFVGKEIVESAPASSIPTDQLSVIDYLGMTFAELKNSLGSDIVQSEYGYLGGCLFYYADERVPYTFLLVPSEDGVTVAEDQTIKGISLKDDMNITPNLTTRMTYKEVQEITGIEETPYLDYDSGRYILSIQLEQKYSVEFQWADETGSAPSLGCWVWSNIP